MDYKKYIIDQTKFLNDYSRMQYWEIMLLPTFIRNYYYEQIIERLEKK